MPTTHLGNALLLGAVIHHVASAELLSRSPTCLETVDTCISGLCRNMEQAAGVGARCGVEGCQIIGPEVCNMSARAVLQHSPWLGRCLCIRVEEEVEEEEHCRSLRALTTQCHQKPAVRKRSTPADMDWKASGLLGDAHGGGGGGGSGSCVQRTARCLGDQVCNRKLGPLLQACTAGRCNRSRCREAASLFYGGLPPPVADLLGMCECGPGDEQCQHVAAMLHGGTCGEEPPWSCLEGLNHCLGDRSCRQRLRSFVSACWRADSAPCGGADGVNGDCVWLMDPALLLSGEVGCRAAFVALVGTPLRYPCTCAGLNAGERRRCDAVSDVLRNRSRFAGPWQPLGDSYQNIGTAESESEDQALVTGHLLYGLIYMALVVIVISVIAGILCKSGVLRKTGQSQFHPPGKTTCVVIL